MSYEEEMALELWLFENRLCQPYHTTADTALGSDIAPISSLQHLLASCWFSFPFTIQLVAVKDEKGELASITNLKR